MIVRPPKIPVIQIAIGEKGLHMNTNDVIRKLRDRKPGPIRTHAVNVEGVLHPVKEAFAEVTGLDLLDFNTYTARNAFKRLGFEVVRVSK